MYNLTTTFIRNIYPRDNLAGVRDGAVFSGNAELFRDDDTEHDGFDAYLIDVLSDLKELKKKSVKSPVV